MQQLDLLNYRRSDPETSKEAGEKARDFRCGDHGEILAGMARVGLPVAAEEISDTLGWDNHVRVNRRLGELEKAGLVAKTTERHKNRGSRRSAVRYRLTVSRETSGDANVAAGEPPP